MSMPSQTAGGLPARPRSRSRTGAAVRVVAEALFYRGAPVPGDRLDFIADEMVALLAAAGPRARLLFRLCLFGLILLAPLWRRRLPPLGRLALPERIDALSRMEDNPVGGSLVLAVKAALCVIYYEQPAAARELGVVAGCHRPPQQPLGEAPSWRQ